MFVASNKNRNGKLLEGEGCRELMEAVTRPAVASFPYCHLRVSAPKPPATGRHPCLYPGD